MADLKISQLTAVSEVQGTDVFPTVSGLATMKASAAQIKTYVTESLDANDSAVEGSYVTAVNEADGVISVTREAADVNPTANSTKMLTSGGAKAALDEKQNVLTFDNTPTENSNNPVKSGGVYAEVNSLKENLTNEITTRATLGAHNLFTFDLEEIKKYNKLGTWNGNVYTVNTSDTSITFTVNNDKSITVNGMLTGANVFFNLVGTTTSYKENNFKNMIMLGCPSGGGDTSGYQMVALTATSASGTDSASFVDAGSGVTIDSKDYLNVYIRISKDKTITNKTFYPMFCLATDAHTGYTPYAKTNTELTQETTGLTENEFVNGAVNMLPNNATTQVVNGVTYTVNSDGSVSTSGTASANSSLDIEVIMNNGSILDSEFYNRISGKQLKLTGCPSGGADNTFYLAFNRIDNVDNSTKDTGNGVTFNFTKTTTTGKCYVTIYAYSGVNMNGKVFKPMLTLADMPNSDYNHYVPYAKSNKQLTEAVEDLSNAQYFDFTTETSVQADTSAQPMTHTIANDGTYRVSLTSKDVDAQNGATLLINGVTIGTVRADIIENNVSRILKLKKGAVITNTNSGTARYRMDVIKLS